MNKEEISFEIAEQNDLEVLEVIRVQAFEPIFRSFRKILGEEIYTRAQMQEDLAQKELLSSYFQEGSVWQVWKAVLESRIVGFLTIRMDRDLMVGEIGLNAIDPAFSRNGFGTRLYQFAVDKMKQEGMRVATVVTGGDPSHLPARKAYRNAGFSVEIPSVWMCLELN